MTDGRRDTLDLGVDPERAGRAVLAAAAMLGVVGLLAALAASAHVLPWNVTRLFNPDQKLNVPTGFKTTALLATALLLLLRGAVARRDGEPRARGWTWLAAGTGLAFLDETTYLHQSLTEVLDRHPWATGVLHYAWWLLYLPLAAVAGVLALRFLLGLPAALRARLVAGGLLYGLGAFGFEPLKSAVADAKGEGSLTFGAVAATSDALQMLGLALLVAALLVEVLDRSGGVTFAAPDRRDAAPRVVDVRDTTAGTPVDTGVDGPDDAQNRTVANVPTRRNPTRS